MSVLAARSIHAVARLPQFLLPNARSQEVGLWSLTKRWSTTAAIGNKFHPSELSVRTTGATFERNDGRSQEVQRSVDVLEIDQFNIPDRVWRAPMNSKDQPLKYQVKRTIPYNTLPVYSIMKPGLGQVWTVIKKIDGDLYRFKDDLLLDFPHTKPILKLNVKQVLCRGKITKEIKLWLQDRGF